MKAIKTFQKRKTVSGRQLLPGSIFIVLVGIFLGIIVNSDMISPPQSTKPIEQPIYGVEVLEIASHFLCSCGNCGDKELVSCTCKTAIREKNFIQELLQKDYERESILSMMESMFGNKKS